ncbi:flavoprotein [Agreia sp. COWG]|uniref:flavoprotein n=1 Tax=Agreia sp. COWG TaxID=2773266 RepID=UPI0019272130|nr:flavoprotein [Agreia sp. COWG]CAD5990950.1 Phosphopantothenoylcysteine decarboxylase [Agreia sp. COWG]
MSNKEGKQHVDVLEGLAGRRIVIMATGALGAAFTPSWMGWLTQAAPQTEFRVVLTPSACQFVGLTALQAFLRAAPIVDSWSEAGREPLHVALGQWADGYLVHPASMSFVSRLCAGLCDSPALLAIQGSNAPVMVAASAPPGFVDTPVWRGYQRALEERPNVTLLPPVQGASAYEPTLSGSPPTMFSEAVIALASVMSAEQRTVK